MGEKYVVFQIGEGYYSIPLEEVSQITRYENVTGVPTAPAFVDGVINVGGDVIPVVNLRTRFALERVELTRKNRVIIVQKQDSRYDQHQCGDRNYYLFQYKHIGPIL